MYKKELFSVIGLISTFKFLILIRILEQKIEKNFKKNLNKKYIKTNLGRKNMIEKIMKAVKSSNKRRGRNITIGAGLGDKF